MYTRKIGVLSLTHRLLITGGSGLLGVNWAVARRQIDEIWLGLNDRHIFLDNTKSISLKGGLDRAIARTKPNIIIHTAAMADVDGCEADLKAAVDVNCDLAATYAKAAYDHGLRFVHISTDHLFDGFRPMLDENTQCAPINNYGYSKWLGESAVLKAHPGALILRINFFGWGPAYRHSFSDWIMGSLRSGKPITLYSNVYFTPLYVGDTITLAHQLIEKSATGIYNLTSSDRVSKFDFGLKVARAFGLDVDLIARAEYSPLHSVPRPLDMSLDNTKTRRLLKIDSLRIDEAIANLKYNEPLKKLFSLID